MHLFSRASCRALAVAAAIVVPVVTSVTPAYAASWQIVPSPNPTGNDGFAALTAISPANLWAVGSATSLSSSSATLTAQYNGTSWQVVLSPNPAGGRYDDLTGVSGTSASDIWSVGMEFVKAGHSFPIIEHYNGSAWSLGAAGAGRGPDRGRGGDSHQCVGGRGRPQLGRVNVPMIQHYNGSGWTEVSTPVTTVGTLTSVTALSASDIWAVGYAPPSSGLGLAGLAVHYDSTSWTVSPLPAPNVPVNGEWQLSAISASSASNV